jgi:polyisoprenoid-binding protein YceI
MRHVLIAAMAALALGACSRTEQPAPQAAIPAPVSTPAPAGTYEIDPDHVSVTARISHLGLSHYAVRFNRATATLVIDPANPAAAQLNASVDINSLDTPYRSNFRAAKPDSPYRTFEQELLAPDFLNGAQFANATFKSTSVTMTGADSADVAGDLTWRGVTKPVTLHVIFRGGMPTGALMPNMPAEMGFSATGTFKRSDFGFNAFMLGPNSPGLGDDIQLDIEADMRLTTAPAAAPAH